LTGRLLITAASFDNPDDVAIVIHNYRWRLGMAAGERKYDDCHSFDHRINNTLEDAANRATYPDVRAYKIILSKYSLPDH
jgi:hypothetical protein